MANSLKTTIHENKLQFLLLLFGVAQQGPVSNVGVKYLQPASLKGGYEDTRSRYEKEYGGTN